MQTLTIVNGKRSETVSEQTSLAVEVAIDGSRYTASAEERLVDLINRVGLKLPQVCYHPQLGPVQTCDTCFVEINGQLVRACATTVTQGMSVSTGSSKARAAQQEAFDRILSNHMLYCTVCDNNNGNCTVHNTTKLLAVEHQLIPFQTKPYEVDSTNPFYRYDLLTNASCAAVVWKLARTSK